MPLAEELAALDPRRLAELRARGFDPDLLLALARTLGPERAARDRLPGPLAPPAPGDLEALPGHTTATGREQAELGGAALRRGEVALAVLAGGMATRMGGVVKALVEALDGHTFLDLRLAEHDALRREHGAAVPLWLMTSEPTAGPIRAALGARLDGETIATFPQRISLRLTQEGELFVDERGEPSVYATGHGDLPDALRDSSLLARFVARGGRVIQIANLDNVGALVDPRVVGFHLAHGEPLTVEVVDKTPGDRGGIPARHEGRRLLVEEFRLPRGFDPATVRVFNTNTFLVDARALLELKMEWTYVMVEKPVRERRAIQFERLLGEITRALEPRLLHVPREGGASRFLPVKDGEELARRRAEIARVAGARGLV